MTSTAPAIPTSKTDGKHSSRSGTSWRPHGTPGTQRIEAFTDGVFAIAITLLVLELKVPEHLPPGGLAGMLPELLPKFAGHAISFLVLGAYWLGHHSMFMHIQRHDRNLMWLNLLFLMFIGIMPFFAGLLVNYPNDESSIILYAVNLALAGVAMDFTWWYASRGRRLVRREMDKALIAFIHRRILAAPVLYVITLGISFASHLAATTFLLVVPLLYILPTPVIHYHDKLVAGGGTRDSKLEEEEE